MSSILACTQLILNLQAVFQVAIRPLAMVAVLQIVMVTELMLREQLLVQITDSQLRQTLFLCEFWIVMAVVLRLASLLASTG
jgi:hypothetical protein